MASFAGYEPEDRARVEECVSKTDPASAPFAHYNLGCAKYYDDDFDGALEIWRKLVAADVDPLLVDQATFQMGRALDAKGDAAGALEIYRGFARKHADDALTQFNMGELLSRLEQFDEAETAYLKAVEFDKSDGGDIRKDALVNLAEDKKLIGDVAGCVRTMRRVVDVDPADYDTRLMLASVLRGAGDVDGALVEAKTAAEFLDSVRPVDDDEAAAFQEANALAQSLIRELTARKEGREAGPA